MFAPTASPVVQRQSTWHIGPTTCVFTSRSARDCESDGSSLLREPRAHRVGSSPSIQRASVDRLGRRAADEARGARDPVGEDVGAEAARLGDRPRAAVQRRRQPALGVRERDEDLLVARGPSRRRRPCSRSSYSPSSSSSGPTTETGITATPVSDLLRAREGLEVDRGHLAVEPERLLPRPDRARDRSSAATSHVHGGELKRQLVETEQVIDQSRGARGVRRRAPLLRAREAAGVAGRDLPGASCRRSREGKGTDQRKARRRTCGAPCSPSSSRPTCSPARCLAALNIAPDPEAELYYSTMVQDESRHTEAWLKLIEEASGTAERDPHLDELAHMTLEATRSRRRSSRCRSSTSA